MLRLRALGTSDGSAGCNVGGRPHRPSTVRQRDARRLAAVGGAWAAWTVGSTLVRIRRLRRTATAHAHDLPATGTVGEGGDPLRLVVLGDSAARGFGLPSAEAAFPQQVGLVVARATGRAVAVTSLATDGHRVADVLADQVPALDALRPDAVVVSVGVNDAVRGTRRGAVADGTDGVLQAVRREAPGARVVLVPCPDLTLAPGLPRPLNRAVGWRCRRVARVQRTVAEHARVPAVPLPRPTPDMFGPDGFHPGAVGHRAMGALVGDEVARRFSVPPHHV